VVAYADGLPSPEAPVNSSGLHAGRRDTLIHCRSKQRVLKIAGFCWPILNIKALRCCLPHPARYFRFALVTVIFLSAGSWVTASGSSSEIPYRLHLFHTHTGERLDIVYRHGNRYDAEALVRINQYLRDYRTGDVHEYDPHLLDLLHDLLASQGRPDAEIDVLCGYRTPRTNEYLRTHGHGVARRSLHMQGMAIDIRVPGVSAAEVRDTAITLHRGGVGYYATSDFVHVDVGRIRRW
jgi:uncharacterized protein YcbK (DUF882 family)